MRFLSIISPAILAALLMSACRDASEQSPAIQLSIDPTIASPVEIEYSPYNDPFGTQTVNLQPDSAGVATLDMEFPDGITDFDTTILIGQDRYGAHIERGQTLHVSITAAAQGDSKAVVTYSGKNAGISRVLTSLSNGFSLRDYFPLDADTLPPLSSIISSIERERESYSPQLDTIADQTHRSYYTRYINRHADAIKMMAINIYSNLAHTSPDTVAEYRRIMSSINPDDEIDVRTDLYSLWLNAHNPVRDNNDFTAYQIANLRLIDSVMTNPHNRRLAFNATASNFTSSIGLPRTQLKSFNETFSRYAADYPDLVEKTATRIAQLAEVLSDGDKLPFDPVLDTPDGQQIHLSALYGKALYIDFWATWCGPCRAEIPHMEQLYKHFNGNPGIQLVSISVDADPDAWLAMIKKDRPGWPQYRLPEDENQRLSQALNIEGIPRFIILAPDGTLISAFAGRPSDKETAAILDKTIAQY